MAVTEVTLWVPLASGVLGILGALGGTWITQGATRKREDRRWNRERELDQIRYDRERLARQRERRDALYVDLAEYAQSERATLDAATDEYSDSPVAVPDLQHPDRLTARVRLYASPQVDKSWAALVRASEHVRWEWSEGNFNEGNHKRWMDSDDPAVVKMDNAIKELQAVLRKAVEGDT